VSDSVTLMAVGDIMLGESPACDGFGVGSKIDRRGPLFPFLHCLNGLQSADVLFGNLEVVISAFDRHNVSFDQSVFRAQPEAVDGLKAAGFDVLSLATNHIMQHGQQALDECLRRLREAGISVTGIARPEMGIQNFQTLERGGLKLGFLGYNQRPQQYFLDPPSYVPGDADAIIADIAAVRSGVDFLVISIHWGDEFIDYPSSDQVRLAHRMVDAGASLVLGHHPHVVQGVELYGAGIVAYSLGNFVFDMWQTRMRQTMILTCRLARDGRIDYEIIPVEINSHWQPEDMGGREGEDLVQAILRLADKISVDTSPDVYREELRRCNRSYRRDIYKWYLAHMFRYPPRRLAANLGRIAGKRLFRQRTR
jgi:poly-gamma-glutamate synthesis protein (capsule biosynthesis protein)